jgi:prepilin-type N-terminal cleavage/methylation domain-containing protein/prepilin-type processing-associated H-X9-DG protein
MRANHRTAYSPAFTLVELLVVVMVIGLTACLLLPALAREKQRVQRMQCVDNLKVIGLAFKVHNFDQTAKSASPETNSASRLSEQALPDNPYSCFQTISNELESPQKLICPADSRGPATDFGAGFGPSHLSYFKNLDAADNLTSTPLSGDRNVKTASAPIRGVLLTGPGTVLGWTQELHRNSGNILFSDGSVQQLGNARLKACFDASKTPTRLAIP